jgi:AraC family transcriptional regulator of adaptative response / DNA-3-methyladenine glycosylase II
MMPQAHVRKRPVNLVRTAYHGPMPADTTPLQPDACYLALKARDARFDGSFFTGVTSTGIYCRPVCKVRTPRRENCRFFGTRPRPKARASGPACAAGPSWRRRP